MLQDIWLRGFLERTARLLPIVMNEWKEASIGVSLAEFLLE